MVEQKFACRFPDHFQLVPQRDRLVAKSCCQFEFPGVDGLAFLTSQSGQLTAMFLG